MMWRPFTSLSLFTLFAASHTLSLAQTAQVFDSNGTAITSGGTSTQSTNSTVLEEIYTLQNRRISSILGSIAQPAKEKIPAWLSTLGSDGKWPDSEINYATGCDARRANWPAQGHWMRILTMTVAWHDSLQDDKQSTDNNTTLKTAISSAMNYWFARDFTNPACLDQGGTDACPCDNTEGSLWNTNWFSNIILIPEMTTQTCLVLNDTLTQDELDSCARFALRTYGTFDRPVNGLGVISGANALDVAKIAIDHSLLTCNASLLADAYNRVHSELQIKNNVTADGIRADGSFGQHAGILYNGNYGKDYTNDALDLEIQAAGTSFAADLVSQEAFSTLFDGDAWMIFRNIVTGTLHWDFSALGRFISFPVSDLQATSGIKINLTEVLELGQEWSSQRLVNFATSLSENSTNANAGNLLGNRMFYANDYMVQRGPNYVTSVKMYSSRSQNTECTNLQNPLGFHLSDGAVHTYLAGDEYEDIAAAWDWNLIPGITIDYGATALDCSSTSQTGVESFVGGVSDNATGIAVMRFTNPTNNGFSWQKAWFFLENDVQHVMISNISSTSGAPVYTVLDQRLRKGEVMSGECTQGSDQVETLWHGDVGYTFPDLGDSANLVVKVGRKTGNWSNIGTSSRPPNTVNLFTAWIEHTDILTPISYTVFPGTNRHQFERKSEKSRLENIQNDPFVSAVFDHSSQMLMIVFWQSTGGYVTFTPNTSCAPITISSTTSLSIIYRLETGEVTVSDPSQSMANVSVSIALGEGLKPRHWSTGRNQTLMFQLPTDGKVGDSITRRLE